MSDENIVHVITHVGAADPLVQEILTDEPITITADETLEIDTLSEEIRITGGDGEVRIVPAVFIFTNAGVLR